MGRDDCIFCRIIAGQIPCTKVYEDDAVLAFLDIGPISPGHTLVVAKPHVRHLYDADPEVLGGLGAALGRVAGAVVEATGADGCNVLCNNGRAAGQLVDHVHFHVIPRRQDDGLFPHWPKFEYEPGQAEAIAQSIREKL